jgi:hypothetical protein
MTSCSPASIPTAPEHADESFLKDAVAVGLVDERILMKEMVRRRRGDKDGGDGSRPSAVEDEKLDSIFLGNNVVTMMIMQSQCETTNETIHSTRIM